MSIKYWEPDIETCPLEKLNMLKLSKLQSKTLVQALKTPFYKARLNGLGITSPNDVQTLEDFQKLPFTGKNDLRTAFPYGLLATPKREVVRMHASSGTTGIPTVIYHNQSDLNHWTNLVARGILATGCTSEDVFQNMMTYGLFTGGLGLHYGAEKVGMMVIPASGGNTLRQFKLMKDFETTVVHATPSYMLHMLSKLDEEKLTLSDFKLKRAFIGAEPHSEDMRKKIEELWKIQAFNSYGLSEMNGPGVAFECEYRLGMHIWEDAYIVEIIDPDTLKPVPEGETGELVLTTLDRESTPLLRYRTRDLTRLYTDTCPCGRTHRRVARMKGRSDDMMIINGVNVFPSQIEEVIMSLSEVGNNYQIVVEKDGALDRLIVKTEVGPEVFTDDARTLSSLKDKIREKLKTTIFINPTVELHEPGFLPVYEGKAKRVFDQREKNQ